MSPPHWHGGGPDKSCNQRHLHSILPACLHVHCVRSHGPPCASSVQDVGGVRVHFGDGKKHVNAVLASLSESWQGRKYWGLNICCDFSSSIISGIVCILKIIQYLEQSYFFNLYYLILLFISLNFNTRNNNVDTSAVHELKKQHFKQQIKLQRLNPRAKCHIIKMPLFLYAIFLFS